MHACTRRLKINLEFKCYRIKLKMLTTLVLNPHFLTRSRNLFNISFFQTDACFSKNVFATTNMDMPIQLNWFLRQINQLEVCKNGWIVSCNFERRIEDLVRWSIFNHRSLKYNMQIISVQITLSHKPPNLAFLRYY